MEEETPARPDGAAATVARLRGLLDAARLHATGGDRQKLLEAVARTISETLRFRTAVVNLYRRAGDDFEVAIVHGDDGARDALVGSTATCAMWDSFLDRRWERAGCYLLPHGEFEWPEGEATYTPDLPATEDPCLWHPEDALFVPMHGPGGELLGILSVDEPLSGRKPTDDDLEVLSAVAAHAGLAIAAADEAVQLERHRASLDHLLRVSAELTVHDDVDTVLGVVCDAVREALGFERVAVLLADEEEDWMRPRAEAGWGDLAALQAGGSRRALAPLFAPAYEQEGCYLLDCPTAMSLVPVSQQLHRSTRNGRGPVAWDRHWLLVPLRGPAGSVIGVIWVDDPGDCLLPSRPALQALRLFADQAVSALESARQKSMLRYLAEHDPLTGLRNRRDLRSRIDAEIASEDGPVSLLLVDLDRFKQVNDELGHDAGDRALARFADLLRETARATDVAARLGGEEFALVLPATGAEGALLTAEKLRRRMRSWFADFLPDLTVSIGIATSGRHAADAQALLAAGDHALYAAKHLGRDRSIVFDAELVRRVRDSMAREGHGPEQLSTVILLAETLDMRDPATARHSQTVGAYSELIARRMGWDATRTERMRIAGLVHDVGKVGVPDAILMKPAPLEPAEAIELERHCELGARIVADARLGVIGDWVLSHHERNDGRGYPHGLAGEAIPIESRVLAVADAYEAMTADRPYRPAMTARAARAELAENAGTQFDGEVVEAFLDALAAGRARRPVSRPARRG